ncbi:regulation of response to stimulus [Branchiostoma belcheri]|nr:regulation of response to stimulus [Branchiostoma belcheri]
MACKYRRSRIAAQNVPVAAAVQADPCHQFIDVTQLVSNRMYKTSNEALILAQASGGTDLTGQGTNYRSSVLSMHTYYEIKDEDVNILPDIVTAEEERRTERRFSTVSTTNDYEEIKDEDVYDPTTSHTYSEIRDEDLEVRGISVNVVRVENRKLSNTSTVQTASPIVSRTHGSRQSIDITGLISNPMYKTSSAQPDCTDPKEQSTCRHSSGLSTHSYCEIDDDDVYDPSSTHFYSEIKDDDCP